MFLFYRQKKEELYPIGKEIPLKDNDTYRFLDSITVHALKTGKTRMMVLAYLFLIAFIIIGIRLFDQTILKQSIKTHNKSILSTSRPVSRADIVDRKGRILATSLPIVDLYVDARYMPDAHKMAEDLISIFPDLNKENLIKKLLSKNSFIYLRRNLTPQEQYAVNRLGYPQLNFEASERRVYPHSHLFSHLIGFTNIDNVGIAGIEKQYENILTQNQDALTLSVDIQIQDIVHTILSEAVEKFTADGAVCLVLDAKTSEVLAMVSLPDFDLNKTPIDPNTISLNKATVGMYELGSVMKPFTVAFGLESGLITPQSEIEAFNPYKLAKGRTITDFQAEDRILTVPEILIYSSNIGTAKIAQMLGPQVQRDFLNRFHFLSILDINLPEKGHPIVQKKWDDVETATIGYGYGLAVSPLHLASAFNALVNNGLYQYPTFIKDGNKNAVYEQLLSEETSQQIRQMLRGVVKIGSAKQQTSQVLTS